MAHYEKFRLSTLAAVVGIILTVGSGNSYAESPIQFNTQFLDVKNGTSLDLNRFSRKGYIMPGKYTLRVMVNENQIAQESIINYYIDDNDPDNTYPCLTPELLPMLGLKPAIAEKLTWMKSVQCLQPGATGRDGYANRFKPVDAENYYPPRRIWNIATTSGTRLPDGMKAFLACYLTTTLTVSGDTQNTMAAMNMMSAATVRWGANLGPWRLRADWQGNYRHENDNEESFGSGSEQSWDWNRYYAYRAIPQLQAQFTLGEGSLESDIFDGFNYLGGSLITDDQMLPPNLRGYAPDISGVARTNAKVTVTQRGRVIYESQVPAGPFRIQDINETVSGDLHVKIEEQNGQVQEYDVSTASIPFLTRPGQVRYKVAAGRPQDWDHHMQGGFFTTAEASWGITNGWSLYGGAIGEQDYQALAIGLGRDLALLGAISIDMTHSRAVLDEGSVYGDGTIQGNSFRASYAKDFDDIDGRLTFAGYRFSEENYMTMDEFIDVQGQR